MCVQKGYYYSFQWIRKNVLFLSVCVYLNVTINIGTYSCLKIALNKHRHKPLSLSKLSEPGET